MEIKTPVKEAERKKSVDLKKEKSVISKKDLKLALVAKRLSMLQDDHQTEIQPILSPENQKQSQSTKPSKDMDTNDHTLFEDNASVMSPSKIPTKIESRKRARDISDDDESLENRELVVWVPPQKKERAKKKRVKTNDSSNEGNVKASKISTTQKFPRSDLSDPLPTGDKSSALKRAEEIQANLSAKYPSFVKLMLKSHVSGGFWLGLPKKFCDKHLPECDSNVVLVDEAGKKSSTKYLAAKVGLSGGWRGFSIDHGLLEGDVLVFRLIAPTKFQIYVVRGQTYGEVDGSLELLTLNPGAGQQISEGNSQEKVLQTEEDNNTSSGYLSQSNSDIESGPEVLEGIQFSDSDIKFEGVEGFEDFHIVVDGLIMDSKFSANTRKKYYELCHSQSSFLHENFLKGLNCNLVVGIIAETINIADAIKSCKKASTSHEDLRVWEKTLKGFEMLGMKVDFLLTHINQLLGSAVESDTADESNKLKESIIKRALAKERMNLLENKLTQLKDSMQKINFEMDAEIKMSSALKQEASRIKEIIAI